MDYGVERSRMKMKNIASAALQVATTVVGVYNKHLVSVLFLNRSSFFESASVLLVIYYTRKFEP